MKVSERLKVHHDSATSFRGLLRPSAVFAIRIPADLADDLSLIGSVTHINRNALITAFLFHCVANADAVLEMMYADLAGDSAGVSPLGFISSPQSLTGGKSE